MSVLPTPVLQNANAGINAYRGIANSQLEILKQYMALGNLSCAKRIVTLNNGVVITCIKVYNQEEMFVTLPSSTSEESTIELISVTGFILQPRSGNVINLYYYIDGVRNIELGVVGGWADGKTVLDTQYVFPLIDNDKASFINGKKKIETSLNGVRKDVAEINYYAFCKSDNYGNLYWHNDAVYDHQAKKWNKPFKSLSWKGTPTRHGRVPSNYNIPGLSMAERALGLDADVLEYTTFGSKLYNGGVVYKEAPVFSWPVNSSITNCLILGASITTEGAVVLVTQNDHSLAPKYVWLLSNKEVVYGDDVTVGPARVTILNSVFPAPNPLIRIVNFRTLTKPGFFIGVWSTKLSGGDAMVVDGWELLLEIQHARIGLPWFGNFSGTSFVCSNGDKIDITGSSAAITLYTQPTGTSTQTALENRHATTYTLAASSLKHLFEYRQSTIVNSVAVLSFNAVSDPKTGEWGDPVITYPDATPSSHFDHFAYNYTDNSLESMGIAEYCYSPVDYNFTSDDLSLYPHMNGNNTILPYEYTGSGTRNGEPCIGTSWPDIPLLKGVIHTIHGQASKTTWTGDFPGITHSVHTDFTVTVCGVNIPIIKTDRTFSISRTPFLDSQAEQYGYVKSWVSEHCDVRKTTIHFLDERYNVCLYKTVHDSINLPQRQNQEVDHYVAYGVLTMSPTIIIRPSDYTATTTEEWHLVVDGTDSVIATTTIDLFPFGEPMHNTYYTDVCTVLCFPKIPASSSVAPSSPDNPTNAAAGDFGSYEDGYDDVYGAQAQADGGTDYFYPGWCRSLQEDPFWASVAGSRYNFTAPGASYPQAGTTPYTPPEVVVEPIPIGSFARHPMLNDMYQFLITKFNGSHIVVSSTDINAKIDEQLALAKDDSGISLGLATHDTTLYYPISIV